MTERWRGRQPPEGEAAGEPRIPPSSLPAPVVAGIAHDLRNLLTAIGQNCELACADDAAAGGGEHLAAIAAAAERAAGLAGWLMRLALGRAEGGPSLIDVGSALSGLRDAIRAVIGPDIALRIAAECGAARVRIEPGAFDRILLNLAGNARAAMPGGGRLAIDAGVVAGPACGLPAGAARTGERWVHVTVTDSGKGIDARVRARLFEPGVTTGAAAGGCGQGLAVVRALVEGAGGRVFAEDAAGGGARFVIALPIAGEAAATGRSGPPPARPNVRDEPPATAAAAPGSILLVEDEAAVRALAARALRAGGYRVIEAASAEDALAALTVEAGGPDLLIADLMLPGIGGRDLAAILQRRHAGLRVILVSGLAGAEQVGGGGGGTAAGGTLFLEKPYALAELRAAADAALGRE